MADTYNLSDVFISYSRKDSVFVRKLFDSFKAQGKEVWADFEDIPKAADWWKEIQAGIEAADSFVFVISPDSVRSDVCRQEVDHAVSKGKRFLPLLYRDVTEAADKEKIHPAISAHNWIFCRETDDYDGAFKTLMDSVNTDLEHNRMLKRLLVRAQEWDGANRNPSYALRGEDLQQAQMWLTTALNKTPPPMALHIEYINFSLQQQRKQERQRITWLTAGFVVSLVLAVLAIASWFAANEARGDAEKARDIAQVSEKKARSLGLAASAIQALVDYQPDLALELAMLAAETNDQPSQTTPSLAAAIYNPGTTTYLSIGSVVGSTAYNPDGTRLAVGGFNGSLCLWTVSTSTQERCLSQDSDDWSSQTIRKVKFDSSNTRLFTSSTEGKLTLWNVDVSSPDVGKVVQQYVCAPLAEAKTCTIADADMSVDGSFVVFALRDGRIGVWRPGAAEAEAVQWFDTDTTYDEYSSAGTTVDAPTSTTLSKSGYRVLTGYRSGVVLEWYVTTGEYLSGFPESLPTKPVAVTSLAYSPNGLYAVVGYQSGGIQLWNLLDPKAVGPTFEGQSSTVTSLVFHPNGRQFFSAAGDNSVMEWDITSGKAVRNYYGHEGGINSVAISPDGAFIASGGYDAAVRLWRTTNPIMKTEIQTEDGSLIATAYDPKHQHFATAAKEGMISIYDQISDNDVEQIHRFQGFSAEVLDLKFTVDGASLLALYDDKHLISRDVSTAKRHWSRVIERDGPLWLTMLPDNKTFLVIYSGGWGIYDLETGTEQSWVAFARSPIRTVVAHPGGEWVAVGVNRLTDNLFLANWRTGEVIRAYPGHKDGIIAIAFDDTGDKFVTGSYDTDVRVWETNTGNLLEIFSGHNVRVVTVAFVPNSSFVISGSDDHTMRLWNMDTNFLMYRYQAHTNRVASVYSSADGRTLISAGWDGRVLFWGLPQRVPEMLNWARKNRYIRTLTCAESNLYLGENEDCTVETTE